MIEKHIGGSTARVTIPLASGVEKIIRQLEFGFPSTAHTGIVLLQRGFGTVPSPALLWQVLGWQKEQVTTTEKRQMDMQALLELAWAIGVTEFLSGLILN
jgi:hypothetical protein